MAIKSNFGQKRSLALFCHLLKLRGTPDLILQVTEHILIIKILERLIHGCLAVFAMKGVVLFFRLRKPISIWQQKLWAPLLQT